MSVIIVEPLVDLGCAGTGQTVRATGKKRSRALPSVQGSLTLKQGATNGNAKTHRQSHLYFPTPTPLLRGVLLAKLVQILAPLKNMGLSS